MGNYNNRGFSGPMGGAGGYQNPAMGGFQPAPMGGMQQFGGFQNRGGMMGGMRGSPGGMRGGRGGMGPTGMMGAMPMGGMGMGGMPGQMGGMGMGMGQMGGMQMQGMHGFNNPSTTLGTTGYNPATAGPFPTQAAPNPYTWNAQPAPSMGTSYPTSSAASAGYPSQPPPSSSSSSHYPTHQPPSFISSQSHSQASPGQQFPSYPPISPLPSLQTGSLKRPRSQSGQAGFPTPSPHFNPAFFQHGGPQAGNVGDGSWNPHGAKRTRQE